MFLDLGSGDFNDQRPSLGQGERASASPESPADPLSLLTLSEVFSILQKGLLQCNFKGIHTLSSAKFFPYKNSVLNNVDKNKMMIIAITYS